MPRAGLSPRAVVDIALDVVDDGGPSGWADLALSTVAHRAGVAVPSLYKHVDGLPALRSAVAARCVEDLTAAMTRAVTVAGRMTGLAGTDPAGTDPAAAGPIATGPVATGPIATGPVATGPIATGPIATDSVVTGPVASGHAATDAPAGERLPTTLTGAAAVRALALAIRAYALDHPGRYRAVQGAETAALGPESAAPVDLVARAVRELGLPPDRWVDQVRTVRAAVHGFVELELGGGFGLPEDVEASFRYLVETLVTGLR